MSQQRESIQGPEKGGKMSSLQEYKCSYLLLFFLPKRINEKNNPLEAAVTPGPLQAVLLGCCLRVFKPKQYQLHPLVCECLEFVGLCALWPERAAGSLLDICVDSGSLAFLGRFLFTSVLRRLVSLTHRKPQPGHLVI